MKQIPLTQGLFTFVDDEDFESLSPFKWYAYKSCNTHYAARKASTDTNGNRCLIHMHRVIINAHAGLICDHIDGNGLNNMRTNLRIATKAENAYNQSKHSNNSSGYKGVDWHKRSGKWQAQIMINYKKKWLGYYMTPEAAHNAYCAASTRLHGEFARHY